MNKYTKRSESKFVSVAVKQMKNPFIYGEEVSGNAFCNRKDEIAELVKDIENGENIIIFSPRRYGKTSLIKEVIRNLQNRPFLIAYIDLYPAITKEKFIEVYARALSQSIKGKIEVVMERIKELLPRLLPKIVIRPDNLPEVEFEYDKTTNISPILDDLLTAVKKEADRRGMNGVVVFDEFQEIANYGDDEIEKKMRSVFQSHRNVSYIFMGSKHHLMFDMFYNLNRPFYKSGKHFPLGKIEKGNLISFIKYHFKRSQIQIEDKTIEKIVEISECHPYYTQYLCHILWDEYSDQVKVEEKSVALALLGLLKKESTLFATIWDTLTLKQKQVLAGLSQQEKAEVFSTDFLRRYNLGAPSSVQKALKGLMEKELIEKENGQYIICDIFFKRWILEQAKR
ncbi:MAG: ATP-binding protein [bacterium]